MSPLLDECADLPLVEVGAGECIIVQDAPSGPVYVLVSGAVQIERDGMAFARNDSPGAILGEMSTVLGRPATATVRTIAPCRFRVASDGLAFVTERPLVALAVMRTIASRLDDITRYLADVKRQFADQAGHLSMLDSVLGTLIHQQPPEVRPGSRRDDAEAYEADDL